MPEFAGLFGEYAAQFRVRVAERADRDAGGEIQIFLAVCIPQPRAFAARRHNLQRRVVGRHHRIVLRAGDGGGGGRVGGFGCCGGG